MSDLALIFSLISLGFFGGFTHCIGMCGPFVLAQVGGRLEKTKLEDFSGLKRLQNFALLPYHLGRISTYAAIGFFCAFFTTNLQEIIGFKIFSALFLIAAALVFADLFFEGKLLAHLKNSGKIRLRFKSRFLEKTVSFFSKKISVLFQNPQGLNGYFLGVILGFIPCGLLYAAFMIASSFANPILAACGMIFFGLSTFPSLFFTACGSHVFTKIPAFKFIAKIVLSFNAATLVFMAAQLIN